MGPRRVLLIEPLAPMRDFFRSVIDWPRTEVTIVASIREAIEASSTHRIDALVVPDMLEGSRSTGIVRRLVRAHPAAAVVIVRRPGQRGGGVPSRGIEVLEAPVSTRMLWDALERAVGAPRSARARRGGGR